MTTLPKPIRDIWLMIAVLRRFNDHFGIPRRNALPIQSKPIIDPNAWTDLPDDQGIQIIPIDWDMMKRILDPGPPREPRASMVNLCRCHICGSSFGKAFAKHDAKGNTICRSCAETPTNTNDSDNTPSGAD